MAGEANQSIGETRWFSAYSPAWGMTSSSWGFPFSSFPPPVQVRFSPAFPRQLANRLLGSEPHHPRHRGRFRLQTGVKTGVVVLDRRGGVLEAVAGEHAHHGGAGGYFVFALQ